VQLITQIFRSEIEFPYFSKPGGSPSGVLIVAYLEVHRLIVQGSCYSSPAYLRQMHGREQYTFEVTEKMLAVREKISAKMTQQSSRRPIWPMTFADVLISHKYNMIVNGRVCSKQ